MIGRVNGDTAAVSAGLACRCHLNAVAAAKAAPSFLVWEGQREEGGSKVKEECCLPLPYFLLCTVNE